MNLDAPWELPHASTADQRDIFYCFRLILGRSPNREEWKGHSAHAGRAIDAVVGSYLDSLEFARRAEHLAAAKQNDQVSLVELKDFSMYVQEGDLAVGHVIQHIGEYEPHVSAIFRERLKPGMHVLDVGGNIGYFALLAASLVGAGGSVLTIEPNPTNVKLIEASRRTNQFDQVTILQAAAGREIGLLVLNAVYSNGTTASLPSQIGSLMGATTVPCINIDDIVSSEKHIDLIKIDVEGAEYNALLGASATIKRCHPTILSEFSPQLIPGISNIDGRGYLNFLLGFNYKITVLQEDGGLLHCGRDVEKVMQAYDQAGKDHIDLLLQ